jgi:flagellar hook-associated protein 2
MSSVGIGSGLDVDDILTKLQAVENKKLVPIQDQITSFNTRLSGLSSLLSALSSLQSAAKDMKPDLLQSVADKFATYTGSFSDDKYGTITIGSGASAGSHQISVDQLAQAQKLTSTQFSNGTVFANGGTLTLTTTDPKDSTKTIQTDISIAAGATLDDVKKAINDKKLGVNAGIISDGKGNQYLTLSSSQTGSNGKFSISGTGDMAQFATDGTKAGTTAGGWQQNLVQEAQQAKVTVDGIQVESSTNEIKGALEGITFTVTKEALAASQVDPATGKATASFNLDVSVDNTTKVKGALEAFVKAFNSAASTMTTLGSYTANSDGSKTVGQLQGNYVLRDAQNTVRNTLFSTSTPLLDADGKDTGQTLNYSAIGISFGSDGTLTIDEDKLDKALADNPDSVANLAVALGKAFDDKTGLGKLTDTVDGTIKLSQDSTTKMRDLMTDRLSSMQSIIDSTMARYKDQFSSLDTLITQLQSTSDYLTSQLSNLVSTSSKK